MLYHTHISLNLQNHRINFSQELQENSYTALPIETPFNNKILQQYCQ